MWSQFKSSLESIRDQALDAYADLQGATANQPGGASTTTSRRNLSSLASSFGAAHGIVVEFSDRSVRVMEQIAEGGYSTVFLGEDVVVDGPSSAAPVRPRRYAVKRIACGGKDQLDEAKKEIGVMERLSSHATATTATATTATATTATNVLPLLGWTRTRGGDLDYVYMLFDLYDGNVWDVVQSRIQVGRYLSEDELDGVFRQLCLALDAMHAAGMAHRDVKPHNILLKDVDSYPYGKWSKVSSSPAVLMDFGSVTDERVVIQDRKSALQTQENAERYSTAPYRAPELWDVASSCVVDGKVDVWAAGCVLYYMMVGETPFERISNQAGGSLMLSILNGSFTWPDRNKVELSDKYVGIVEACLAVDPAARPTIREVLAMVDGGGHGVVQRARERARARTFEASAGEPVSLEPLGAPLPDAVPPAPPVPTASVPDAVPNLIDL